MSKVHFSKLAHNLCCRSVLRTLLDVVEVLFPSLVEDQDVIQVHYYKLVGDWMQYVVNQPHECCGSICQLERHDEPFEKSLLGFEGSLPHIRRLDLYLVIPGLQVNLAKIFFPLSWSRRS